MVYNVPVMKNQTLTLDTSKYPYYVGSYEREILDNLSAGEITMEVIPVYDIDSISKRVYISVQIEQCFSVQASLDSEDNLFNGWIDMGLWSANLHPTIWNMLVAVLGITSDKIAI